MTLNNNLSCRRSIRLPDYDYRQPGSYFITINTQNREPLFGEIVDGRMQLNPAGCIVQSVWDEIASHYPNVILDEYVVMPDHFHGILVITDSVGAPLAAPLGWVAPDIYAPLAAPMGWVAPDIYAPVTTGAASSAPTLGKIIRRFKSKSAIAINRFLGRSEQPLWQRNYWERVIRGDCELTNVRNYIRSNPSHWKVKD